MRKVHALTILSWMLILSPCLFYVVGFSDYGVIPNNDYYGIIRKVLDGDELSRNPMTWIMARSNEHRVTLPVLVYALNIALTNGNNLALSAFALVLMGAVTILVYHMLPADLRRSPLDRVIFGLLISMFCFTPVAAHGVVMGFSGTIWYLANAFSMAAIIILTTYGHTRRVGAVAGAVLLGFLASFSYSTSMSLWLALVVGILYLRLSWKQVTAIIMAAVLGISLFLPLYDPAKPQHPALTTAPWVILKYTCTYIGAAVHRNPAMAMWLGIALISGSILLQPAAIWATRKTPGLRVSLAPWLMLQIYSLGNAIGTAMGRADLGILQSRSSRYSTIASFFWVGFIVQTFVLVWLFRDRRRSFRLIPRAVLPVVLIALAIPIYQHGMGVKKPYVLRASRQPIAAIAMIRGIYDRQALRFLTYAPRTVRAILPYMKRVKHVPFDRESQYLTGHSVEPVLLDENSAAYVFGFFDRAMEIEPGVVRIRGWAFCHGFPVKEVLVLDNDGNSHADIVVNMWRPDIAHVIDRKALFSGWAGYLKPGTDLANVTIYARPLGEERFYRLATAPTATQSLAQVSSSSE